MEQNVGKRLPVWATRDRVRVTLCILRLVVIVRHGLKRCLAQAETGPHTLLFLAKPSPRSIGDSFYGHKGSISLQDRE